MPALRREPLAREEPAELQVAATNGSIVTDSRGRKYIDFVMGWCVGNFGLCVAKAMSGGLAPIGAVIATAPVAASMEEHDGTFYSTYGWHPRSVAAAIATLRDLKANRRRLLAGVAEMSDYFRVRLLQLEFDRPAAVRIQGLAIGIDVGDEDYADSIVDKSRRHGLLVSTEGSTVLLLPSLAIDKRTAARGLDILARSM